MKTDTIIQILIGIVVLFIIIIIFVLVINNMQESIEQECEKINNEGIIKFVDFDVNCSAFKELENRRVS